MKKVNFKDILVPTVALFVFCLVATALLAGTNLVTSEKIAQNAVEKENSSRMIVLPEGKQFGEVTTLESGITYCEGKDDSGNSAGYVFTSSAKGYGGAIGVMIGVDTEGVITGIEILSHAETPGLGANATGEKFKGNFVGKSGVLTVDKNSNDGQNIQAITAATITSKAVTSAVNAALTEFEALKADAPAEEITEVPGADAEIEETTEAESATDAPEATTEEIAAPEGFSENEENSAVLPEGKLFGDFTELESGLTYSEGKKESGETAGYVFTSSADGYRDEIDVLVGIDTEGVITGIEILYQAETDGLGSLITGEDFKGLFVGKSGELTIDRSSSEGQSIQAITSATVSSAAVVKAVNAALAEFENIKGGAVNG